MRTILIVGIGGGIGSILRYIISLFIGKNIPVVFPAGTFIVNCTGCFLIGMFYSLLNKHGELAPDWKWFLITGICGGYTTFSTFSYDGIILLKQGAFAYFMLYIIGSVILGLLATFAGIFIFK